MEGRKEREKSEKSLFFFFKQNPIFNAIYFLRFNQAPKGLPSAVFMPGSLC